jgi:hypothetical protein
MTRESSPIAARRIPLVGSAGLPVTRQEDLGVRAFVELEAGRSRAVALELITGRILYVSGSRALVARYNREADLGSV